MDKPHGLPDANGTKAVIPEPVNAAVEFGGLHRVPGRHGAEGDADGLGFMAEADDDLMFARRGEGAGETNRRDLARGNITAIGSLLNGIQNITAIAVGFIPLNVSA